MFYHYVPYREKNLMARQYTQEFKLWALRLAEEDGRVTGTARTLGLAQSVLWRWKKAFEKHGPEAFPGHGIPREVPPEGEEAELAPPGGGKRHPRKGCGHLQRRPAMRCSFIERQWGSDRRSRSAPLPHAGHNAR